MQEKATIARPYARAAFEQAQAVNALKQWSEMLGFLAAVIADATMRKLIHHPKLDPARLAQLLVEICGPHMAKDGANFIRLLADAGRLAAAPEIYKQFELKRAQAENVAEVEIMTAFELDEGQCQRLTELIARRLKRQVHVATQVDGSIIGGVVIRSGDSVVDASVRGRLRQLGNDFAS